VRYFEEALARDDTQEMSSELYRKAAMTFAEVGNHKEALKCMEFLFARLKGYESDLPVDMFSEAAVYASSSENYLKSKSY
jgi:hypothetical protein